jgi:hypothetical protein
MSEFTEQTVATIATLVDDMTTITLVENPGNTTIPIITNIPYHPGFPEDDRGKVNRACAWCRDLECTDPECVTMLQLEEEAQDRIRQEVTLYGIRVDVAEELTRLSGHLQETRAILAKGGQVGKRLDFMMQELNREANTLGSKAALKELSDTSMKMKLLIEQMREQVQNLE